MKLPPTPPPPAPRLRSSAFAAEGLTPLKYNNPGLVVDLGVGLWAWPLPMDFDGDGDLDLVVNCPDKPYNGIYFFENASGDTAKNKMPVFKPAKRISKGAQNVQVSYINGKPVVLTPGNVHPDFLKTGIEQQEKLGPPANVHMNKVRGNMWRMVDFDGDGKTTSSSASATGPSTAGTTPTPPKAAG
jgi:hypothetical protein